jgi:hypothetical protein
MGKKNCLHLLSCEDSFFILLYDQNLNPMVATSDVLSVLTVAGLTAKLLDNFEEL